MMRCLLACGGILASLMLCACTSLAGSDHRATVSLPLNQAWMDGQRVEYITTDISDPAMAQALGVNLVPRLAQALPVPGRPSVLERVYKFVDDSQISVFPSAPNPTGPANADRAYSPLWRMVLVRWNPAARVHELKSEEQILRAAEANEVALEITNIVVNCPITRSIDGRATRGAR